MKFLVFLFVAIAVYMMLRHKGRIGGAARPSPPKPSPEAMVSCAHCGLHVPASESVEAAGRYYCSEEHKRLNGERDGK